MKLHKKQLGSALSLFLTLSILLSMLALPAMAKAPAEGATLTLDDTLLTLDQSEETFVATLKVPVSQEQKNWADNQWKDWADSIQWSLTRDKVDVQSPEYYPNIYTGDDLENWMSWGHINSTAPTASLIFLWRSLNSPSGMALSPWFSSSAMGSFST